MSLKNSITTSDYLEFDATLSKANKILKNEKFYKISFLVITGINVGLRISDLKNLTFEDIENGSVTLLEKKTKKRRTVTFNENVIKAYEIFKKRCITTNGNLFLSNKGTIMSTQHINFLIKKLFGKPKLNVSSHSLRKTFGRRVWDNNQQNESSLIYLSEIFCHSNVAITRRYLGIKSEQLRDIYLNL